MTVKKPSTLAFMLFPIIICLMISSISLPSTFFSSKKGSDTKWIEDQDDGWIPMELDSERINTLSQDVQNGILEPVQIKQTGSQVTDAVRARTDTGTNTVQNITIDDSNGWFINYTQIEVSNLKQLYAVNGTFENGVDPWTNYTVDGGSNTQIPGYDSESEYITCRNIGDYQKVASTHRWTHSAGSEIGFSQVVNNSEGKTTFNLQLDFRYATGPIDPEGDNGFGGDIGVFYQVDDDVTFDAWYYPMETTVTSRDAWYSLGHEFTVDPTWTEFNVRVGLWMAASVTVNNITDYDDDPLGLADGTENAQNLTLYIDNVEFSGVDVPSFEKVNLTFHAGAFSEAITGSGTGYATVSNPSYWTVNPLEITVTSNTSVVFTYTITSLYHRYVNSSWISDPTKQGVSYSIDSGQSADLSFYTYVTASTEYENLTMSIEYPQDWDNATIWDPLRNDITSLCTVKAGSIGIPNDELDRVGWWEIELQSPNYAKNISVQIQDSSSWVESSLFRSGNTTRTQVEIGTVSETPVQDKSVNITWILPNSTIWTQDSITAMMAGIVNSSSWNLGGSNTTAGQWVVNVFWINGSEIAYDSKSFDMYHQATVSAYYDPIEIDTGQTISNWIFFQDIDSSGYLVDDSVTIVANWSSSSVSFSSNPSKNRWEATFDTSLIGAGEFVVVVNASRPYFDNVSCTFTVISTFTTEILFPGISGDSIQTELNQVYSLDVQYLLSNGTGIEGATLSLAYTGPSSGLIEGTPNDLGDGNYSISITGILSGEYTITINATKTAHQSAESSFYLTVNEIGTSFASLNGTAGLVGFGLDYRLVLNYTNSTGGALAGATVEVFDITPSTGLSDGAVIDETNGIYSVTFTPTVADTYIIVIKANVTNHVTQYVTFTLLVTEVPTTLTPHTSSATIALDQEFILQLSYDDQESTPIPGATIVIEDLPTGLAYVVNPLGGGLYNVTLTPSVTEATSFQISFKAYKENYQNATAVFSLFVQLIPTELTVNQGEASETIFFNEEYQVTLAYTRTDIGTNILSATISVSFSPASGVSYTLEEIGGMYRLTFTPTKTGIWQITVTANRTYYVTSSLQLELEVNPISTTLESLNGTADTMSYGESYSLVVRYLNATGDGLIGATITVPEISPSTGLSTGVPAYIGDGNYSILLTPSQVGTYSLVIRAELSYHVTQYLTFTIIVNEISTTLAPHTPSASVYINQSFLLQLSYEDSLSAGIIGADITLINPPSGITHTVLEDGGGIYNVTLTPTVFEATSFQLSFRASLTNFENASTTFSLLVQLVNTDLVIQSGSSSGSVTVFDQYTFTLSYLRLDLSQNISGADIAITTSPATGLVSNVQEINNLYYLSFSASTVDLWQITVIANRTTFVQSTVVLELDVRAIDTTFVSLNGTADDVGFGLGYTLVLDYSNSTGDGILGADVEVVDVIPSSGLTIGLTSDEGDGIYSIVFTPTVASSYTINIGANITNHVTKYITFTLMVTDVATVLIPETIGATISVDQSYSLLLTYEDEASNPVLGATITLLDPPTGLDHSIQEVGSGVYNVTLTPLVTEATSFQLSFRASQTNYQTASTAFSLLVQKIPTELSLLQGSTSAEIVVIDSYTIIVAYVRTDSNQNITSADITVSASPVDGLSSQVQSVGDVYQIAFTATRIGIWQITINANKTNFVSSLVQIELETKAIDTTLSCLNGTAGLVEIGVGYNIVVEYENATSYGILAASIGVSEMTPATGLDVSITTEIGNGLYSIIFTPNTPQTYTIVLKANTTNHASQYITFSLTVLPVETVLIPHVSGWTISIDKNFTLELLYEDEESNPVLGATIEVVDLADGLTYTVLEVGSGFYNVTLYPSVSERTSFQISFRATQEFYQSSTTAFSLLVREIPTQLSVIEGLSTANIQFMENYEVWVSFVRSDTKENITDATITPLISSNSGVTYSIEQVGLIYHLIFETNTTGNWQISLRANKTSYEPSLLSLELTVNAIDTTINQITLVESLIFGREYNFTFEYAMENGTRIEGASPSTSGSGSAWATVEEVESGRYFVIVIPDDIGSFEVDFEFSLHGYVTKTSTLSFTVETVVFSVVDVTGLDGLEGQMTTLSLRIVESDTLQPVTGATVAYQMYIDGVPGSTDFLEEAEDGRYIGSFIMPSSESSIQLRVYIDKEHHVMEDELEYMQASVVPSVSELTTLTRTFTTWSPLIVLFAIVTVGYQVRRHMRKRERRQNLEALAVKRRFDDVKNMVGVVVLHKGSGIPVYSRMLRAGFDDSLISAFITAISQFRSEFDVSEKEWQVTPISDIIMAVKTQNLVCAFITMGSPTTTQQERMINFAKAVGFVFDSIFEEAPILAIDDETEDRFDELFDELLDINLHMKHKIVDIKGLPKGPKCLSQTIDDLQSSEGFHLDDMADRMAVCGIEEARAYKIILDAIEKDQLIPVEGDDSSVDTLPDITEEMVTLIADDMEVSDAPLDDEISEEDKFVSDIESLLKSDDSNDSEEPEE